MNKLSKEELDYLDECRKKVLIVEYKGNSLDSSKLVHSYKPLIQMARRSLVLEEALEDLKNHGIRFDLNPTIDLNKPEMSYLDYIKRIDASIRQRAEEALKEEE